MLLQISGSESERLRYSAVITRLFLGQIIEQLIVFLRVIQVNSKAKPSTPLHDALAELDQKLVVFCNMLIILLTLTLVTIETDDRSTIASAESLQQRLDELNAELQKTKDKISVTSKSITEKTQEANKLSREIDRKHCANGYYRLIHTLSQHRSMTTEIVCSLSTDAMFRIPNDSFTGQDASTEYRYQRTKDPGDEVTGQSAYETASRS